MRRKIIGRFTRPKDKSPEAIEAYIDAMMRVRQLLRFSPETDRVSIPLIVDHGHHN